jgi:hypothetical protein
MEALKEEFSGLLTDMYDAGWNAALELAADKLEKEFRNAFGKDTLSGIAIYLRGLKK